MAGRESYALKYQWKNPTHDKHRRNRYYPSLNEYSKTNQTILKLKSVWYFTLRKFVFGDKWDRKMFYTDNIKSPFNKLIGCRITKHKWYYMDDEERAFCTKCHKNSGHISREQWGRMEKLRQIKKRTKK